MTSLSLRSKIRQITWFYFSAVERVEAKEQTRKVAFFPRHSLKHKHHSSLYIPQWHTSMEKQSRPTCLPSINPTLHPAWHQECTAAGLGWAGTATQPSAGCKGTRATPSCFSSSTCWKQLEQTWHQAFTPSETRKRKSCFSRASSAAQRLCCSYLLFPNAVTAAVTSITPPCKPSIPAHFFHYPSKRKHQSLYELRLGWVCSGFDYEYCEGCSEIQHFPHPCLSGW